MVEHPLREVPTPEFRGFSLPTTPREAEGIPLDGNAQVMKWEVRIQCSARAIETRFLGIVPECARQFELSSKS